MNRFEKMAQNGIAFRSPCFKKIGLVGEESTFYNQDYIRDLIDKKLNLCNIDIDIINEGYCKFNAIIKLNAQKKNGKYNEKDIIGRFTDCGRLIAFINGYYIGLNSKK